jgi:hypothetical protein
MVVSLASRGVPARIALRPKDVSLRSVPTFLIREASPPCRILPVS